MTKRTCQWENCEAVLAATMGRGRRGKWCPTHKAEKRRLESPDSPTKICTEKDCSRPVRAKGVCATHYNQQHQPNRHAKAMMPCSGCGEPMSKEPSRANRYGKMYCTQQCRDVYHWLGLRSSRKQVAVYIHQPVLHMFIYRFPTPLRLRTHAVWVTGVCADCDAPFTDNQPNARYCSTRCTDRAGRRRRRALEYKAAGEFRYSDIMRQYRRQGYACAYCKQPCSGLPDPEHVMPLSRGGRNDMTNLVAACRSCNTDKSDLMLTEWAIDRARRRLAVVDTLLSDAVYSHLLASIPTVPAYRHREAA